MAMMSGGVVRRKNTIEENRKILSELSKKNEFLEPSHRELSKLFTRLNANNARELVKDMKSYEPDWDSSKITNYVYGHIPEIPCGSWWGIRMDCSRDGMHDPFSASVQCGPVGAVSICTSHSNEDVDLGDMLTFTGHSFDDSDKHLRGRLIASKKQDPENRSLILSFENQVPIRIIRSYNLSNEYSPKTGYRYDGLYMVVDYWIGVSPQNGDWSYKFALKRLVHQEPPPWKLEIQRGAELVSPTNRYSNNGVDISDATVSHCASAKRFHTRDKNTLGTVKSLRKRRLIRQDQTSSEEEPVQSTSTKHGGKLAMPQSSLPRKIVSTDYRNVHVSAIVTRRVSKKLSNNLKDNNLLNDCAADKSWKLVRGNESQQLGNEGEEDRVKSQNTRLQNTNISIRTDLYESSYNPKYNVKKCGSNIVHGSGSFTPRIHAVPRRELNLAGIDSSPGSSRTVCSVKMERIKSIELQMNNRNLNHISRQGTDKAVNVTTNILSKSPQSSINEVNLPARENQTSRVTDIYTSSPSPRTVSSSIENNYIRDKDAQDLNSLRARCRHRFEHSYASELPNSLVRNESYPNLMGPVINCTEKLTGTRRFGPGNPEDNRKTESGKPEVAGSSTSLVTEPEFEETDQLSVGASVPVVDSPSQSPVFRGFQSPERLESRDKSLWLESSIVMNSLTFEEILSIITEEKSSPMAKILIGNVIGLPNDGSCLVFDELTNTDTQIQSLESSVDCDTPERSTNTRVRSEKQPNESVSPGILEKSSTQNDRQNLEKPNRSKRLKPFENSKRQEILEVIYTGDEDDVIQGSIHTSCSSRASQNQIPVGARDSEGKERDSFLRLHDNPQSLSQERKKRVSRTEDIVDLANSKLLEKMSKHCDTEKSPEQVRNKLTITRGEKEGNSSKRHDPVPEGEDLIPDVQDFAKSSASHTTNEGLEVQPPSAPQILTRSKCLRNSIHGEDTNSEILGLVKNSNSRLNCANKRDSNANQNLAVNNSDGQKSHEKLSIITVTNLGFCSMGKDRQSDNKVGQNISKHIPMGLKDADFSTDDDGANRENVKSKSEEDRRLPKEKPVDKMRLIKRTKVRMKRKFEIANLSIDMNMSPLSQMSRSRRTLRDTNYSCRRSCRAVMDRGLKRRNDESVKHPTSPLKRLRKSIPVQSSSMQRSSVAISKKGSNVRNRTKNGSSSSSNNIFNNNNNNKNKNNPVKRIGKAEKVINKIRKPINTSRWNLVAKKNTVYGLRSVAEIPKRHDAMARTRSGIIPKSLTVGRLGPRRALLTGTETYTRKKKKKKEKQKQTTEKIQKHELIPVTKQSKPEKKLIDLALKNTKLGFNTDKEIRNVKQPEMVSAMTQCSLIPIPLQYSPAVLVSHHNRDNNKSDSCRDVELLQSSDNSSVCPCSSHHSDIDEIKDEIIELIEIKSDVFGDDVVSCNEEQEEMEELQVQTNTNFTFNRALIDENNHQTSRQPNIQGSETRSNTFTPSLQQPYRTLGIFDDPLSCDSPPRKGFVPYVARRKSLTIVPVRSVKGDSLRLVQIKSIGFKPIKPGMFPHDSFEESSKYARRSTSDSPRITYSSAVVKRGVHEEYDKYTSEENNVVQYMDSKLCYEDIENEDIIYGIHNIQPSLREDVFIEKMEFANSSIDSEDPSNDNSPLREREYEEQEEMDEFEPAKFEMEDIEDWQSQLDENSSNSENTEQAVADSDGDVPWHGWKKITSNKETHFVGW